MDRKQASKLIGRTVTWKLLRDLGLVNPEPDAATTFVCAEVGCSATQHKAKGLCARHYQKSRYEPCKPVKLTCSKCKVLILSVYWTYQGQSYCTGCLQTLDGYPMLHPAPEKHIVD